MDREQALENMKAFKKSAPPMSAELKQEIKRQNAVKRAIVKGLGETALTVPQLAEETGFPPDEILWHINAMRKYGTALSDREVEGYLSYRLNTKSP